MFEKPDEGIPAIETKVHRYGGDWARDGSWEFTIHEYKHASFIAIAASFEEQQGIRWLVSQQIARLVQQKMSDGHQLICADATSAYFKRL